MIRIDLLGFGGSEKPESGYSIPEQASTVAEALNELDVQGALVAGNSMGGSVTASLAEQASQLVDRAVLIDMAPERDGYGDGLPFLAKLGYTPVLGEAMWRITPDFAIEDGFSEAFAPGYDTDEGFENPDQIVDDFRAMTYTSYDEAAAEGDDFTKELPLDERFKQTPVPLMVIFGAEDQIFDADVSLEGYADVPGVQTELIQDAGHAPQVEKPEEVAELIDKFRRPGRSRAGAPEAVQRQEAPEQEVQEERWWKWARRGRPVIRCENLSKRYGEGEASVLAVDDVSLEFPHGQLTSIVGPSGSGKSTLMHVLAGLDRPTDGQVWVDGTEITALKDAELTELRRDKLGFIFQFFNLIPVLSAEENVTLADADRGQGRRRGVARPAAPDRRHRRPAKAPPGRALRRAAAARRRRSRPDLEARRRLRR